MTITLFTLFAIEIRVKITNAWIGFLNDLEKHHSNMWFAWRPREQLWKSVVGKALFTWQIDSMMTMINGTEWHTLAYLGLQSISTCHVVVPQSWLISWPQEVINQSSCIRHALGKHLARTHNSILQHKPINRLAVTMWSLGTCRKLCWFTPKVMRQSSCLVNQP